MYESFFGLQQEPFSIAPDPRFLYMSDKHREALSLLGYGLTRGASFVLLTGEIGAGKTTVWRRFLDELPSNYDVANVVNPKLDVNALLARVFEDLQVELPAGASTVDLIDALHGHLLLAHAQGRRTLIVIDEAQALSSEVLEQLRLLTNLDSSGRKLQVMLIGQPEMRQVLERPELEPLAQRIVARYHLPALSEAETTGYIRHRLNIAGLRGALPFDGESIGLVHRICRGVPRRINVLCDRALAVAHAAGTRRIGREIVQRAAAQAFGVVTRAAPAPKPAPPAAWPKPLALAGVAAAALAAGVWLAPRFGSTEARAVAAPAVAAPAVGAPVVAAPASAPPPEAVAVVPVAAPASSPPPVSIEAWFGAPLAADEQLALRALAGRWGQPLGAGDVCLAAAEQALQCYRSRGGLAALRQLDRPGLLRLVDERGRVAQALLVALDDEAATLSAGGSERTVPLAELARWWRGEFATLWRMPPGYRGSEPATVDPRWLAQQFARVDGQAPAPGAEAELRSRIFAFQLAQGLTPDGVPGPLTLMRLNRAAGVEEPRLLGRATSGSRPS
jgi:general secretion pathway protein A